MKKLDFSKLNTQDDEYETPETPKVNLKTQRILKEMNAGLQNTYNPDKPLNGRTTDLDLMLYSINRRQKKSMILKECVCFYLPYLFLILCWVLFSQSIFDGYHMNQALKNYVLLREDPTLEIDRGILGTETVDEYWLVNEK